MRNQLNLRMTISRLAVLLVTFCCSFGAFAGGGVDGGGNGIFMRIPTSGKLVLLDLFVNNPTFSEWQDGDQIELRPVNDQTKVRGEWIDYRQFKSFAYLKTRLARWSTRAPNLFALLNEGGFARGVGPASYRLLLIATHLHVQSVDEISVPDSLSRDRIQAYPSAYYDDETGHAFLNIDLWNGAGIVSQAAMLLHERMRGLQMNFYLSNEELQRAVYAILLLDPNQASASDLDDSHFSKSWIALHTAVNGHNLNLLLENVLDANVRGAIFDCSNAADPKACLQQTLKPFTKRNLLNIDPVYMTIADSEIDEAVRQNILGSVAPGPINLVSKGSKNGAAPALPANAFFAKMYGVYTVTACKNPVVPRNYVQLCDFNEVWIYPNQTNSSMTIISLRQQLPGGGIKFATVGAADRSQTSPFDKYSENGDVSASLMTVVPNQFTSVQSIRKMADSTFVLTLKSISKTDSPDLPNYDYEMILKKK